MRRLTVALGLLLLSGVVHAENFVIGFKDTESLKATQQNFAQTNFWSSSPLEITQSLPDLNLLVVKSDSGISKQQLEKIPGVLFVDRESFFPAPSFPKLSPKSTTQSTIPATTVLPKPLQLIQVEKAWEITKGRGAKILVIDSGVDKDHPLIKGKFVKGRNFTNEKSATEDVTDEVGHGTHVAGIVVGSNEKTQLGVAPEAELYVAKVCTKEKCSNVAIATALFWGLQENVDVITLSLGGAGSVTEKFAIDKLDSARIPVVAAIGNNGIATTPFPAGYPAVTAVGAIDLEGKRAAFSNWSPALDVMAPGVAIESSVPTGTGRTAYVTTSLSLDKKQIHAFVESPVTTNTLSGPVVQVGLGRKEDFASKDLKDKIVLVERGEITLLEKTLNAQIAGAKALVIYNNGVSPISGQVTNTQDKISIPVVFIEQALAQNWLTALKVGDFSLNLDIQAADLAIMSGTSMAAPYVAGSIALIKSARPKLSSWRIRQLLDQTAQSMGDAPEQNQFGKGLLDTGRLVQEAMTY